MDTPKFCLQTQTFYGITCSKNIRKLLKEKGFKNVAILVDEGVKNKSQYFIEIQQIISSAVQTLHVEVMRGTEEPDYDYLDTIADKFRSLSEIDVLIGIGGGSCLDITKAVAVLLTNPGRGIEYRGFDKVQTAGIATIAIPTTAGTGSEVTINAVFTDKNEMKKLGINGQYMSATYAILDAEWTMSCPYSVAVSSGMDALTHALESFMCRQHNDITRIFSKAAFKILYENLPSLVNDSDNLEKRQNILMGAYLAAIALFNSGSGVAAAMSYPIGVYFKVPHGIGGAVFLASVVDFNVKHGYGDYVELLDEVEAHPEMDVGEKNRRFAVLIQELSNTLDVPRYLNQWGITLDNVEDVARFMLPLQAAFDQNPIDFSAEKDARDMLFKHVKPS